MEYLGRRRIIYDREDNEPYLERYYIFLKDRVSFPFNIFIHNFKKGDDETDLHDHPWGYFTLILSGGYWEYFYDDIPLLINGEQDLYEYKKIQKKWRGQGFWQIKNNNYSHRIELADDKHCITLFIPFKKMKDWGFWKVVKKDDNKYLKWLYHTEYLSKKL